MKRVAVLLVVVGCSVSSDQKSFDAPPNSIDYIRVSEMLGRRCGSLDCHGQPGRPLRLYSREGLRLDPGNRSGKFDTQARLPESEAVYESVVALEPEIMDRVFHDQGRDPGRLTLIRKAVNAEHHKGAHAIDDAGFRCLTSWLAGEIDANACLDSERAPPPGLCLDKGEECFEIPPGAGGGGTGGSGGTGGTAGTSTGGAGGSVGGGSGGTGAAGATGGTGATGGSNTGGSSATGGGGTNTGGGGGVVCGPGDFWPCTYDEACVAAYPSPADHDAQSHELCQKCHKPAAEGGTATDMTLGGVVWVLGGAKGAPHVEVGLRDGNDFIYICTDSRGFFFVPASVPEPNWLTVENRIRAALGEKIMPSDKEHSATCNDAKCHADLQHQLWAP